MLLDDHVEALLEKYIKNNSVVSFGTGTTNENFLKKLGLYIERNTLTIKVVPTSHAIAELCKNLKIKAASLDDVEVDLAFDFVDQVDEDFNYISNETTSLIRDKMIAQDTAELIVVCEEKDFVPVLNAPIRLEVSPFAFKKTMFQVMNLGEAKQALNQKMPIISETGNFFVDVTPDEVYTVDDLDYQAKRIPGVLETSLFVGYADRAIIHGSTITVKSRMTNPESGLEE
ncbi:MAG: ribose 5-phosphate isomerase A [archaeon]